MNKNSKYYLIDESVLPEIFTKVIEVKKVLAKGMASSIHEAVNMVGISRGAYYKYKNSIFPFYEMTRGKIMNLFFVAEDIPGVLSEIISRISAAGANVLTIHQNLPINGSADITIAIEVQNEILEINELLDSIGSISGVKRQEILSRE